MAGGDPEAWEKLLISMDGFVFTAFGIGRRVAGRRCRVHGGSEGPLIRQFRRVMGMNPSTYRRRCCASLPVIVD